MAHYQQLEFIRIVKSVFPKEFSGSKVLEVGSWDVTGTIRGFFQDCDYTGVDITEGPGIDVVCQGQELEFPTNSFDVVVSCECFEHNPYWLETFTNMIRMLRPGGLFIMSCAAPGRIEHGTLRRSAESSLTATFGLPNYYKNLGEFDFRSKVQLEHHFDECGFTMPKYCNDLYFAAIKRASVVDLGRAAAVKTVLASAGNIALPKGSSQSDSMRRLGLTLVGRAMESILGARRYQDLTFLIHKNF